MDTVTILMSTYNGEKFLSEQIESLQAQENISYSILVRDDGSIDKTQTILDEYKNKGVLTWYTGENLGPARSFLDLVDKAPKSDYYAFCDQDDVWNPDKLERAVRMLKKLDEEDKPQLYCSNYQLVDADLNNLPDNGHRSTTTFTSALVASNCTGCTTVFNYALLEFLRIGKPDTIVMHDDWAHKVCLAVDGKVIYDETKTIRYRQHRNNADGGVHKMSHRLMEVRKRIQCKDCIRSRQLAEIVRLYEGFMSPQNLAAIKLVCDYKVNKIAKKAKLLHSKKIRSHIKNEDFSFRIAILLNYF